MTDLLIRDVDSKIVKGLKARAKRNGRSLQSELKTIMESSIAPTMAESLARAAEIRKGWGRKFPDSSILIREAREG